MTLSPLTRNGGGGLRWLYRQVRARRLPSGRSVQWGVTAAIVCVLAYLMSHRRSAEFGDLQEGTISRERVVAPFTFWVKKGRLEFTREQAQAQQRIPVVLTADAGVGTAQMAGLDSLFRALSEARAASGEPTRMAVFRREAPSRPFSEQSLRWLLSAERTRGAGQSSGDQIATMRLQSQGVLAELYGAGILDDRDALAGEDRVTVLRDGRESQADLSGLTDIGDLYGRVLPDMIQKRWPGASPMLARALFEALQAFIVPNLIPDEATTEARRQAAARAVSPNRYAVLENQKIIDAHERVTAEHVEILRSLAQEKFRMRHEDPYGPYFQVLSSVMLCGSVVLLLLVYLSAFRPAVGSQTSVLALFGILLAIPLAAASYLEAAPAVSPFYVPVALSGMLAALLFDAQVGAVVSLAAAFLCGITLNSLPVTVASALCGIAGGCSLRQVRHRHHFNRSIVYLTLSYVVVIVSLKGFLYTYSTPSDLVRQIGRDLVPGLVMGVLTPVLTLGLSPIIENLFGIVTPITLLELSDLNRPLLRTLAARAPGTYTHSVIVANLSESAAEAIQANALLARAGCYYHDIGKMVRPQYFGENQLGGNPHDELQPQMSARVLIAHVREGIQMAELEGLPRTIVDMIPQHHGTSEIAYFKHRAVERGMGDQIRDEDFRYPGPRPQTREAGIVMLADSVESAARSLKDRDPNRVRGLVREIIEGKFTSGELDECDLTLRDLHRIEQAFLPVLMGTMHTRVEYPWQRKTKPMAPRARAEV